MRDLSAFAFALAACTLAAPGCGGGTTTLDADFSAATTDQRTTAVLAARGDVTGIALVESLGLLSFVLDGGSTCPTVTMNGVDATVNGGCTLGGTTYAGSYTIKNLPAIDAPPGTPAGEGIARFEWNGFTVSRATSKVVLDGSVELERKSGTSTLRAAHSLEIGGERVDVDVVRSCTASGCTRSDGATVSVTAVGTAEVSGDFAQSGAAWTGALELRGADVLRVDFAQKPSIGCYQTTADGAAVDAVCPDAPGPAPLRALRELTPAAR